MNLADYLDAYAAQPIPMMARRTMPSYSAPASVVTARAMSTARPTKSFSLVPAFPSASMLVRTDPTPPPPPPPPPADPGKPVTDQGPSAPPPPPPSSPPVRSLVQQSAPSVDPGTPLPNDGSESSGDSGTSSSGFGWLLIVAGGYFLYKGLT